MNRSTAALLIAIMFHALVLMLFYFLLSITPKHVEKPQEQRIKVSLREKPQPVEKPAAIKNEIPPVTQAPPLPKGKQLEKAVPETPKSKPAPAKEKPQPPKPQPTKAIKSIPSPAPKKEVKKPAYKHFEKKPSKEIKITKTPAKKSALYEKLSKQQAPQEQEKQKAESGTRISPNIQEAYGEAFGKLSEGEQKYIVDNQEIMRRITQEQLNRLGPVNIPRNLNVNTFNIIEFYLHPNGDITELKIITASGFEILDETSLQTIEYSYHRYPLPKEKTLIRYKVGYYLGGRRY
jgi:outer membrane biosynthesis protein TonB